MLGFDSCDSKFNKVIGQHPDVDNVSQPFFCAATRLSGYTSTKRGHRSSHQRCIGSEMSQYYVMNYTYSFMEKYEGVHQ